MTPTHFVSKYARSLALLVVSVCLGCEAEPDTHPKSQPADAALDIGTSDAAPLDATASDATASDAPRDTDADTDADSNTDTDSNTDQPSCSYMGVELDDGTLFEAQYIAAYDHRFWWWDQADRTTVAFFQEPGFDAYPDDRSFRFVSLSQIVEMDPVAPGDRRCYAEFRAARSINVSLLPLEGASQILMGNSGYHRYEAGMGDFAWDFTRVDDTGARYGEVGAANEDYLIWDEPVYAPVSGYVVEVVGDAPDNIPGDHADDAVNNLVGIHLGGAYYLYLLHLRQGSIPGSIVVDSWVDAGDLLGRVGNSGVTLEPHLHLVALYYDAGASTPRSWSVPTSFEHIEVAPTPRGPFEPRTLVVPRTGESVRAPMD
jgi:hypothetical protein